MLVWYYDHNEASAMSTVVLCNLQSPELVARLQKIRAMQEQQEYDRMVRNIDPTRSKTKVFQLGLEVQSTNRQLWVVVNFLLTVVGAFTFGYFAAHFAGFDIPGVSYHIPSLM